MQIIKPETYEDRVRRYKIVMQRRALKKLLALFIVGLLAVLFARVAFAQCGTSRGEIASGERVSVSVCATIIPMAEIDPDDCLSDPEAENCDMVNEVTDTRHTCEKHPDQAGCQYYKIEPAGGE